MRAHRGPAAVVLTTLVALAGCGDEGPAARSAAAPASTPKPAVARPARAAIRPVLDDAEADRSYATAPGTVLTEKAPSPGTARKRAARGSSISPGAPSDEQIAAELKQMESVLKAQEKAGGEGHGITLERDGTATPADGVPAAVAQVIAGANAIAKFPYVYGGGHGSFVDTAYDCSGSLSYALAAGGLLSAPKTSGDLARTGAKGPGRWITIYANAGHTFMEVDGLRYDTSGRGGPLGTRWQAAPRSTKGFAVRHPPGL